MSRLASPISGLTAIKATTIEADAVQVKVGGVLTDVGSNLASSGNVTIADVQNLQSTLDSKADDSEITTSLRMVP